MLQMTVKLKQAVGDNVKTKVEVYILTLLLLAVQLPGKGYEDSDYTAVIYF